MSPINTSLSESFNERSKQINQASKYTDGNLEKARLMVAGQFNDVVIIKGKFYLDSARTYGIFYIFANKLKKIVLNLNALLFSDNAIVAKARIFNNWRTFYAEFGDYVSKDGDTALPAYDFIRHLSTSVNNYDIYADIDYNNLEMLTNKLTDIIKNFYNASGVLCQIEFEITNSLTLELAGIPMELPGMNENDMMDDADSAEAKRIAGIEAGAEYVIEGRVIISPIRGKDIKELKSGDKIKVLLTGNDDRTILLSKKLEAVTEEGEKLPITVRVKEKLVLNKGGYFIYGLAAKNVLVRIYEEENVKIEPGVSPRIDSEEQTGGDSRLMIYLSLLIGVICILLFALLTLL